MKATIAICTYNRRPGIRTVVRKAVAQNWPDFEVLVVDDGSTWGSEVEQGARVHGARYVRQAHAGLNAARNTAVREARTDLIAFVDDDEEMPESWLRHLIEGMERHSGAGVVGGPALLRIDGEGRVPRVCNRDSAPVSALNPGPEGPTDNILGGNMLVRREAYEAAGPFDERLRGLGDDTEWVWRVRAAGFDTVHIPDAEVWHVRTTKDLRLFHTLRTTYRYGRASFLALDLMGQTPRLTKALGSIPRHLAHAAKARCSAGLVKAARSAGVASGWASSPVSPRPSVRTP